MPTSTSCVGERPASAPSSFYQVSGEYAMLMAAAQNGWLDSDAVVLDR